MDIRFRLYPHPVLAAGYDNYKDASIDSTCSVTKGIRELIFSMDTKMDEEGLLALIDEDKAEYAYHIECPLTSYRVMIRSAQPDVVRHIPEKSLNGEVSICCFIIAKENLQGYKNPNFNDDYAGLSFDIEKGSILGIGGQHRVTITKEVDDLAKIPSIFSICRKAADSDPSMSFDLDNNKIAINLSSIDFQNYKVMVTKPSMISVFHSMIIMPALIYVFEQLRRDGMEEHIGKRWCHGLKKALDHTNTPLNMETLENTPSYELAQKVLDLPVNKALNNVATVGENESEDE